MPGKVKFARIPSPLEGLRVLANTTGGARVIFELRFPESTPFGNPPKDENLRWGILVPMDPDKTTIDLETVLITDKKLTRAHVDKLFTQKLHLSDEQIAALMALILRGDVK